MVRVRQKSLPARSCGSPPFFAHVSRKLVCVLGLVRSGVFMPAMHPQRNHHFRNFRKVLFERLKIFCIDQVQRCMRAWNSLCNTAVTALHLRGAGMFPSRTSDTLCSKVLVSIELMSVARGCGFTLTALHFGGRRVTCFRLQVSTFDYCCPYNNCTRIACDLKTQRGNFPLFQFSASLLSLWLWHSCIPGNPTGNRGPAGIVLVALSVLELLLVVLSS